MKVLLLIMIFYGFIPNTIAQERFFEFLPGWQNMNIIEYEANYISIGLTSDGIALNHYQFSSFSIIGELIDTWDFDLDTVQTLQSRYFNDVSDLQGKHFISGEIQGNISNRAYGTLINFNSDFTDTIGFTSFNILPGNGTQIRSHISINDNKFILGGLLQNTDLQVYPSLMESDSLGNIKWRKTFFCGSNCDLYPFHILEADDGGYFFTCSEIYNAGGSGTGFAERTAIIKTDSLGNQQFKLSPGDPDFYAVRGWVLPLDDGNYITAYSDPMIIFNNNSPQVNPESTIWLNKFDIIGNEVFNKSLQNFLPLVPGFDVGYPYTIRQMINSNDNNIIVVGYTGLEGFILKITSNGEGIWFRLITPPQTEGNNAGGEHTKIFGISPTTDGGYIMAGEYFSSPGNIFPEGIQTAIAVKVDEFGCLEPGCQIGDGINELNKANLGLTLYPNPTKGIVNITISNNVRAIWVRVYGVTGRMVFQKPMTEKSIQLNVGDLVKGMYLLEVETVDGFKEVKQLVVD